MTNHSMEVAETDLDNLAMIMRSLDEAIPVMNEMNVNESSTFLSIEENSERLERNVGSSEATDDSADDRTSVAATEEEFNFTSMSWNIAPSANMSEISTVISDDDITDEIATELLQEEKALEQLSSTLSPTTSTVQQSTGTRGEAKSGAIYEKTDGV